MLRAAHSRALPARRGVALLAFVPAFVVLLVLMVAFVGVTVDSSRYVERRVDEFHARTAASSATHLAVETLWTEWELAVAGADTSIADLRTFLDARGITNQSTSPTPMDLEMLPSLDLPLDSAGEPTIGGTVIESVRVRRLDSLRETRLEFATTAVTRRGGAIQEHSDSRRTVQDVYLIEPPPFEGLDYALLANNVNCIMCHTSIDNAERVYNTQSSRRGTYARTKAGSIETFLFRSDPASMIAGTLYLGGEALTETGTSISNWGTFNLKSCEFNSDGQLVESATGVLNMRDLSPASPNTPQALENLYLDYFAHAGDPTYFQVDGSLPTEFPSPFPDDGGFDPSTFVATPAGAGNRVVDDNEFLSIALHARGHASGGAIKVIPIGDVVATAGDVATMQSGGDALSGLIDGHVYMHGTAANPIILDGSVAIGGDLIISGVVSGKGSFEVRGNVYVAGDLTYADGDVAGARTYGRGAGGQENVLALAAGKNILVGDLYHAAWGTGPRTNGLQSGSWNFTMDELAIFNRMEWMKTQPELPGEPYLVIVGYTPCTHEVYETYTYEYTETTYTYVPNGTFSNQTTYTTENQTVTVPVYTTINHPADPPAPYGSPWTESVFSHNETQTITVQVPNGTTPVENTDAVPSGTITHTATGTRSFSPKQYAHAEDPVWDWYTPYYPNPHYRGPDYLPRYYAFSESSPAPVHNKEGFFDPATEIWVAPERASSWDTNKLTFADPSNSSDPLLYDGSGASIAVVTTLTPTGGWINDDLLQALITSNLAGRDPSEHLAVDAWLYSANSVFGLAPARNAPGLDGKMRINGAVVAADVGLLAARSMQVNYDRRGRAMLDVKSLTDLTIRHSLWAPDSIARRGNVSGTLPH